MNESDKMSNLIMDAAGKVEALGHNIDWCRYNNFNAEGGCIKCDCWVMVRVNGMFEVSGTALTIKCKGGE